MNLKCGTGILIQEGSKLRKIVAVSENRPQCTVTGPALLISASDAAARRVPRVSCTMALVQSLHGGVKAAVH